jgi:hypothetical protein
VCTLGTWRGIGAEEKLTAKAILSMSIYPQAAEYYTQIQTNTDGSFIKEVPAILTVAFDGSYNRTCASDSLSRLLINQVEMYVDGLLQTRTAAILDRYSYPYPEMGIGDTVDCTILSPKTNGDVDEGTAGTCAPDLHKNHQVNKK